MICYISFEYELKMFQYVFSAYVACFSCLTCLKHTLIIRQPRAEHVLNCHTCTRMTKRQNKIHKLCSTCLIYLYWEIVWQHLCLWLQEVHNVLSQVSLGSISLSPSTLLKVKGKQGKVIYRGRLLKTKQIKQYCIFL